MNAQWLVDRRRLRSLLKLRPDWSIQDFADACQSSGYTTERSSAIVQKYRRHAYNHLRAPCRNRLSYVQAFIVSCAEDVWLEGEPPSWISAICSAICRPPPT